MADYNEESVSADNGYANKARREKLESKGIFGGILEKEYRNKVLSKTELKLNRILSTFRNKVERPFAYMKRVLGYSRYSY